LQKNKNYFTKKEYNNKIKIRTKIFLNNKFYNKIKFLKISSFNLLCSSFNLLWSSFNLLCSSFNLLISVIKILKCLSYTLFRYISNNLPSVVCVLYSLLTCSFNLLINGILEDEDIIYLIINIQVIDIKQYIIHFFIKKILCLYIFNIINCVEYKTFYKNGELNEVGTLENGIRNGEWLIYEVNNNLKKNYTMLMVN